MENKIIIGLLSILIILSSFSIFLNNKNIKSNNRLITISNNNYENSINIEEKFFEKYTELLTNNFQNELKQYFEKDNSIQHPINKKEISCLKNAYSTNDMTNCVITANEEWEKELNKYLKLLGKDMPANEYKLITESQNAWKISADKDRKLIDKYVTEKDGTMYIPLSADYHKIITMNRAKFLTDIYYEYIDLAKYNN